MINLKCNTLSLVILASLTFIVFCSSNPVSAQQIVMGRAMVAGGGEPKQMQAALDREIKQIKSVQEQRMTTSIDDMTRVCELSDEQVTKLQVAAKGAIEKSLESAHKQYLEMLQQFGMFNGVAVEADEVVDEGPGPPDARNADAEQTDEKNAEEEEAEFAGGGWQMPGVIDLGFVRQNIEMNGGELAAPEKEKIWTNAVRKTLTDQQAGKYNEALTARTARIRKAAVEAFVAKVDAELLLQESQRAELVKLVNARFAGELEQKAAVNGDPMDNNGGVLNFLFGR